MNEVHGRSHEVSGDPSRSLLKGKGLTNWKYMSHLDADYKTNTYW
jgi:hypothetical protein